MNKYLLKFDKSKSITDFLIKNEKWTVSFTLGLLFLIFSSKFIYLYINMFTLFFNKNIFTGVGCIKTSGLFLSAILFTLTLYVIFTVYAEDNSFNDNILVISIYIGSIFFILNLNIFYIYTEKIKNILLFRKLKKFSCEKTIFSKFILFIIFILIVRLIISF